MATDKHTAETDPSIERAEVLSIRDIAEKHGVDLDASLGKLNPVASLGVFNEAQEDIDGAPS